MVVTVTQIRKIETGWEFSIRHDYGIGGLRKYRVDDKGNLSVFVSALNEWREHKGKKITGLDNLKTVAGRIRKVEGFFSEM
jgi:hypothetical protein